MERLLERVLTLCVQSTIITLHTKCQLDICKHFKDTYKKRLYKPTKTKLKEWTDDVNCL